MSDEADATKADRPRLERSSAFSVQADGLDLLAGGIRHDRFPAVRQ
jgi:hypothetical protein